MKRHQDIYAGSDKQHAETIRAMVKSLGHEIPANWSDETVVMFFNDLCGDGGVRIVTDMEKSDMYYASNTMGG